MITLLFIIAVIILALLRTPLFIIIGGLGLYFFYQLEAPQAMITEMMRLSGSASSTLLAIPLFTFSGYLLSESKAPERLVNLSKQLFAAFPGGIAITTLALCAVFTAFTGASGVTIIAIGGLVYPILKKQRYSDKFALGIVTASGSLGLLFPPSLPIILYGTISETDINQLFLAGFIPGIVLMVILSIYSLISSPKKEQLTEETPFEWNSLLKTVKDSIWEIPIPVLIIIFIYQGIITVPEAAVITAFYVFIIEFFVKKDLKISKDFIPILRKSMIMVGGILIIMAMAMGFTMYLTIQEVPQKLFEIIHQYISSKLVFLLLLNIFLIIVGCMMDIFSAILVVVPIILPVAKDFGIHPIHLGIIFLANLEIGYLTPPVGLNLFMSSFRFQKSIISIYKAAVPFIILLLLGLLLITYIPELSLLFIQ